MIMCFVIAYTIGVFFANMFECTPISDLWNIPKLASSTMGCVDIITMDIITNSWSAFEDLVIWALPIPILWQLKVPLSRKAGLYTLIGISFISVICAFVRVAFFVIWINSAELSWNFPLFPLICTIESSVALITSSLPAIYALFRKPAPEHRRSGAVKAPDCEKHAWNSEGSSNTLQSGNRRSRWSFLAWYGHGAPKKTDDAAGNMPEEQATGAGDEERPVGSRRSTKAYVTSTDEARSISENAGNHGRKVSLETESLCYVGKGPVPKDWDPGAKTFTEALYGKPRSFIPGYDVFERMSTRGPQPKLLLTSHHHAMYNVEAAYLLNL
ncbi:MAG: hypothetical protein LQ345_007174 [Seirophora villosa]|nr:MAG: hypothetical protein LQ345_007174 [Seirophora villosa]